MTMRSVFAMVLGNITVLNAQTISTDVTQDVSVGTLFEAIERGLAVDPRTAAAYAQENAIAAGVRVSTATLLPSLSVEGTATRFKEAMIAAPLHRFDPTAPPMFARTLVQSRWTAAYTLFDGGIRRATIREAQAAQHSANATTNGVEMTVIEAVATTYLSVIAWRELNVAEDRRLNSLRGERDRVQQLFDVGRTPRVSLLRADAALAMATASKVATEQQFDAATHELARLLAVPMDAINPPQLTSVVTTGVNALNIDQLVSRAIEANPQITTARYDVEAKRAAERGTRASWLPTIQLAAAVVTYAGSGVDLTGEWQGGIAVSYPIFTGGARVHRIAGAAAAREAAESSLRARELELAIGVDRLTAKVLENRARVAALTAAVTHVAEVARIEQLALSVGAGVQSDFLRAEADVFTARADLVRAVHGEITALIALAGATGDLSPIWLQDNLENRR